MPGVVIIHAIEDAAPAHALGAKLRADGHEVYLDLAPGGDLRAALIECDAAVALWSPRSIANEGLVAEAAFVRRIGRLIHARMHSTPPPAAFARDPAIDLTGWRGEETFPGWLNLRAAVEGVVAAVYGEPAGPIDFGDIVETEPRKLSEREHRQRELAQREEERNAREQEDAQRAYEQPFRERPFRQAPQPHYRAGAAGPSPLRLAAIGLVTFAVVAGVGIGAYSMIQGGRSAAELEAAWANLDKTNPLAVRAFLENEPGRFRGPAETTLEELEIEALGQARATNTAEAYQRFLTNFPQTSHSAEIRGRLAMIRQRERDQALAPPDLPKPGESANAVGGPAEDPPAAALEEPEDDLSGGGPVLLIPPAPPAEEPPLSTEEQLRRQISGEDRALGDDQLKLQIQGRD